MIKFEIGQKVTYIPTGEPGVVKSVSVESPESVFVVFSCGGDWENYRNYTAALCKVINLERGWRSGGDKKKSR